ncbi:MAG: universal stress protein [Betaproteobacteria bacterium]|nr:universal stress protein [Betaproteobacteria bacterium]
MYKRILVPIDGSSTANLGLKEALRLAKQQGATLCLFHAVDESFVTAAGDGMVLTDEMFKSLRDAGRKILTRAEALARRSGVRARSVLTETLVGPAAHAIIREAKRSKAELIVMGTHGRRGVRRLVMGSDAEQVLRETPVPVLLVRGAARRSARR